MTYAEAVDRLAGLMGAASFRLEFFCWRREDGGREEGWTFYAPRFRNAKLEAATLALLVDRVVLFLAEQVLAEEATPGRRDDELRGAP